MAVSSIRATQPLPERRETATGSQLPPKSWYGRRFWRVVIVEVALLIAGLQVLRVTHAPTQANVAWIALVVGLHFVAFAFVWKEASIAVPGATLSLLGVAGFVLTASSASQWVPLVSGVCSGFVLLAATLGSVLRASLPFTSAQRTATGPHA